MLSDVFPTGYHGAEFGSAWPSGSAQLRSTSARVTPVGQIKGATGGVGVHMPSDRAGPTSWRGKAGRHGTSGPSSPSVSAWAPASAP